ncbi:MAG: DUF1667 domain-containing protein, partial [Anaerovoracaceae bacterium]
GRLKGVSIAPVNEEGVVDYAHKEYIPCDTLLVATGLIPERELTGNLDEETEGLFFCGNVSRVHDLADGVTLEGMEIGAKAATFVLQREEEEQQNIDYVFSKLLSAEYLAEKEGKSADADPVVYGGEVRGNMVCTICPKGCALWVEREPFSVKGHQCQRGEAFAKEEVASPKRTVTTVVKTKDGRLLSVRTDRQIKKAEIWAVMKAVKQITVETPMEVGDTIRENIAGTGAKLIATAKLD